jgi:hypothetical protein
MIAIRLHEEILEMLRKAAAYNKVGYQTYTQWLIESALKNEARYYGWTMPAKKFVVRGGAPTERQRQTLRKLMRMSERRAKKAGA